MEDRITDSYERLTYSHKQLTKAYQGLKEDCSIVFNTNKYLESEVDRLGKRIRELNDTLYDIDDTGDETLSIPPGIEGAPFVAFVQEDGSDLKIVLADHSIRSRIHRESPIGLELPWPFAKTRRENLITALRETANKNSLDEQDYHWLNEVADELEKADQPTATHLQKADQPVSVSARLRDANTELQGTADKLRRALNRSVNRPPVNRPPDIGDIRKTKPNERPPDSSKDVGDGIPCC